jgi:hypothetical protein
MKSALQSLFGNHTRFLIFINIHHISSILLCEILCCHSLTLPRLSICRKECDGIVHYFVTWLDQSTVGIGKNASHTQQRIESQLLINFNTQKKKTNHHHSLLIIQFLNYLP